MPSKRLVHTAVICALLAAGATACNDDKKGQAAPAVTAAPAAATSAAATPSATPTKAPGLAVDTLSGEEISKQAQTAMGSLSSLKIDGTMKTEGQGITMNLAADKKGNCVGKVTISGVGGVEILHTTAQTWIKPDAAFWKTISAEEGSRDGGAMAAELFKGRYLTGGQDDAALKEMAGMCDLIDSIAKDDSPSGKIVKGAAGTTNGVKTFSLTDTDTDGQASTLYIASEGKPYLIKVEQTTGTEPGEMNFSDFDKPIVVQAPPADNVIDYSVFQQKLKSA